ncbi:MAG: hypothetical protein A3E84_00620 [Gammaproteobacteria bacterium RIFCSPHIGHO2_12_FULL_42_13]|nr:MAG: hypothetical protein A3E84_00620 [Gammaproteobacteria bacterium RIFCSPHIGHO2_12_FULL_42_13]
MSSLKIFLAIVGAILSWSSSFVFIRLALEDYAPGDLALFRYLIVSAVMLIFYFGLKKRYKPTFQEFLKLFFFGVIGIGFYMLLLNYAEKTVTASITSFVIGINPVVTLLIARFFSNESIAARQWWGVIIGVVGLTIIAWETLLHQHLSKGLFFLILATIAAAIYNIGQKPFMKKFHAIEVAAISAWSGTLVMLIYTPSMIHAIPQASWQTTLATIYLGVVPGAIGYLLWSYLLSSPIPTAKIVPTLYLLPLFSTLLGWLILNEIPTMTALIGGCIALFGAFVARK